MYKESMKLETLERMKYKHEEVWLPCSEDQLGWDDDFYLLMLNDHLRMTAYKKAIEEAVSPGMSVLDLGTGTGILARWAFEAGAGHVYAIEVNKAVAKQAVANMREAGYGDRFELFNALSYDVELPHQVDLVISEIMGNIGDNEDCMPILKDARNRFLGPDGKMLPLAMKTYIVPVTATAAHQQVVSRNCRVLNPSYKLSDLLSRLRLDSEFNLYYDAILPQSCYLGDPSLLRSFDFQAGEGDIAYEVERRFIVTQAGLFTGFKGYFVAKLTSNVEIDISGDDIENHATSDSWKHCYLPINKPIAVEAGDELILNFVRSYPEDKHSPFSKLYHWKGKVRRNGWVLGRYEQTMAEGCLRSSAGSRLPKRQAENSDSE